MKFPIPPYREPIYRSAEDMMLGIMNLKWVEFFEKFNERLFPQRMTTTEREAIVDPSDGMIVYDTTRHSLFVNENGSWAEK